MSQEVRLDTFINVSEAAKLLGVTAQTLRSWERLGSLVPFRNPVNNYRMYKVAQIEQFLQGMANTRLKSGKFKLKIEVIEEA